MREIAERPPLVTDGELDEDVGEIALSLDDFYRGWDASTPERRPASTARCARCSRRRRRRDLKDATALFTRLEPTLATEIYRWTGHFPERTRPLLRQLAERAARARATLSCRATSRA